MPHAKLTQAFVNNANYASALAKGEVTPEADRLVYWSEDRPGFGLMLTKGGHRSYVVQYRAKGKARRATIKGTLSLADAERQAKALQGDVARGLDPVATKKATAATSSLTLKAVAEDYLRKEGGNLRSLDKRKATFVNHVYPRLGSRPIAEIRRSEIVAPRTFSEERR